MNPGRPSLVLQHEPGGGPGLLEGWLRDRGFAITVAMAPELDELPEPQGFDLVVVLGSEQCAAGDEAWIQRELDLVRQSHRAGIPVFGICFGGQLLARALGGRVVPDRVAEIGWREIETLDRELISPGPWFEWHFDLIETPPEAEVLATSPQGIEAFQVGRTLGVQFHPEVDRELIGVWIEDSRANLERAKVAPEELFEGIGEGSLTDRAHELFDAIGTRIGALEG